MTSGKQTLLFYLLIFTVWAIYSYRTEGRAYSFVRKLSTSWRVAFNREPPWGGWLVLALLVAFFLFLRRC